MNINVIGVRERQLLIDQLQNKLNIPDSNIFYDDDHLGPLHSVVNCLSTIHDDAPIVLLQDDALPCDNFITICDRISQAHPNSVIGLFPFDFLDDEVMPMSSASPYYDVGILSGVGVILPARYKDKYIEFARLSSTPYEDDKTLFKFCNVNNIQMLQTVPAVVQHIGDQSILSDTVRIRRSKYFEQTPVANWDSQIVNHLKYHSSLERKINDKVCWSKEYIRSLTRKT